MKTLILGGVKSGKSREAERIATDSSLAVTVVATALPGDEEMQRRIARHRQQRPDTWRVEEVPSALAATLTRLSSPNSDDSPATIVIVDCLTLWLTQLLCTTDSDEKITSTLDQLVDAYQAFNGHLIIVSNESGMGVTPANPLSRHYLDYAGVLHQRIATASDHVTLMVAGIATVVK